MTHILTHNRRRPVGDNGAYNMNDLLISEEKAPESLENQGLDGLRILRNQQVVCSSHITSSKNALKSTDFRAFLLIILEMKLFLTLERKSEMFICFLRNAASPGGTCQEALLQ